MPIAFLLLHAHHRLHGVGYCTCRFTLSLPSTMIGRAERSVDGFSLGRYQCRS